MTLEQENKWELMADALKTALDRTDSLIKSWQELLVNNPRNFPPEVQVKILSAAMTAYLDVLNQNKGGNDAD